MGFIALPALEASLHRFEEALSQLVQSEGLPEAGLHTPVPRSGGQVPHHLRQRAVQGGPS
ncbi:polyprenyl synthetase family protein, partial [Streptococcus pneumoniae]